MQDFCYYFRIWTGKLLLRYGEKGNTFRVGGEGEIMPWQTIKAPVLGTQAVKCEYHPQAPLTRALRITGGHVKLSVPIKYDVSWMYAYCSLGREEFLDMVFGDKS